MSSAVFLRAAAQMLVLTVQGAPKALFCRLEPAANGTSQEWQPRGPALFTSQYDELYMAMAMALHVCMCIYMSPTCIHIPMCTYGIYEYEYTYTVLYKKFERRDGEDKRMGRGSGKEGEKGEVSGTNIHPHVHCGSLWGVGL